MASWFAGIVDHITHRLAALQPADADPHQVAVEVRRAIDLPAGKRPFRIHVDPADDGAAAVNAVADEIRVRFFDRIGLNDLLNPAEPGNNRVR